MKTRHYRDTFHCVFVFAQLLCLTLVSTAVPAEKPGKSGLWQPKGTAHLFKIGGHSEPIVIPIWQDSKVLRMLVDTGSPLTVFDETERAQLLPDHRRALVDGTKWYFPPTDDLGVLQFGSADRVACLDLTSIRQYLGVPIDGIIGVDVLRNYVVHVDFDLKYLLFVDPSITTPPPGVGIPGTVDEYQRLAISADFGKRVSESFLVDTGAIMTGTLRTRTFNRLLDSGVGVHRGQITRTYGTASGAEDTRVAAFTAFALGPYASDRLVFTESDTSVLGLCYLSRFRFTLNYKTKQVFLERTARLNWWDHSDHDGLTLCVDALKITVHSVTKDSVAEESGFSAGDELVSVSGEETVPAKFGSVMLQLGCMRECGIRVAVRRDCKPLVLQLPTNNE